MIKILQLLAKLGCISAIASVSDASVWFLYQDEEPEGIVEFVQNKKRRD